MTKAVFLKPSIGFFLIAAMAACFANIVVAQEEPNADGEAIALFNQGQDAHEKGDLKTALEFYEKALKIIPDFPEAQLQRGSALILLGRLDEAEAAYRRAVELREDWSLALAHLGSLLVRKNKFNEARVILKKAIALDADNTPAYAAMTTLALKTKASEAELREIYTKIVPMSATAMPTVGVWVSRASLENALNDKKAASVSALKALELDAKNISMLSLLASVSIESGDPRKADEYINKIVSLEPFAAELPLLKVKLLIARGNADEALKLIDATPSPSKELLDIKSQLAISTAGDAAMLEKRLAEEPRNIAVLSRLCSLLRVGDALRAMEFCRRALEVEPNNIEHAIGYGGAMLQAKQYPQAAALFQKLHAAAPENYTVRANFATALFQLKRYNEAKVHFQWLTEKQPANAVAYYFLGIVHDELGEYADAMANYQLFLKHADAKLNQLEIDKVNLRLPTLQRQLDAGRGRKTVRREKTRK